MVMANYKAGWGCKPVGYWPISTPQVKSATGTHTQGGALACHQATVPSAP